MQVNKSHIWYASSMRPYAKNEPWFYDAKDQPELVAIENHWPDLKNELHNFIKNKDDKFLSTKALYDKIDIHNGWSALIFKFWGLNISNEFKKECPKTMQYLNKIPGLVSLSFSKLAPKAALAEHVGDTNAILRCHLGIEIPAQLPDCGIKVNGEEKNWEEGKWLIFNDAYLHGTWNNTDNRRIILIIDVIRPEFIRKKNIVCAFILTRHVSYLYHRIKLVERMPAFIKTMLFAFFLGAIYLLRPVYNLFK